MTTPRVKEILSWYTSINPGVQANLYRFLMTGTLAGTGKLVILPVDQGFEHGPARSFAPNPAGYDPDYHFELALAAGTNGYAAPLGQLECAVDKFAGQVPLILKANSSDVMYSGGDMPYPAVTASVNDALLLGCNAIGFTIYPGSVARKGMYEEIRELAEEAKSVGLAVVIWSYPRGGDLSKEGETAIDIAAYAAQVAAQLGAHIIKVKPPTRHLELDAARKVYLAQKINVKRLRDRVAHVVQSAFNGKRIVIFSGGAAKAEKDVLAEITEIHKGGGFGSIIGRNSFQRPMKDGVAMLKKIMAIYKTKVRTRPK